MTTKAKISSPMNGEPWPTDYIDVNRAAYDALAEEYRARQGSDRAKDLKLIQPFVELLRRQFSDQPIRVLDIGCGNGLNLDMFASEGLAVTGIDFSSHMLEVARESCPTAQLINGEFLVHPFPDASFHGIFAKAIIHLFPKAHATQFLRKVHRILRPGGVFYVTTTVELQTSYGLRAKTDYHGGIVRYRKTWEEDELTNEVKDSGFEIANSTYNYEHARAKKWFNIWAIKRANLNFDV